MRTLTANHALHQTGAGFKGYLDAAPTADR
jgi:hypothetical protein